MKGSCTQNMFMMILYQNWICLRGYYTPNQGFFSKFLMEGELKIFGPHRSPTGTKSNEGGGDLRKKNQTEAKTAHLMQN